MTGLLLSSTYAANLIDMTSEDAMMNGLRQRNIPVQASSVEEARETVLDLNNREQQKSEANQKVFGRTPDGTGEKQHDQSKASYQPY